MATRSAAARDLAARGARCALIAGCPVAILLVWQGGEVFALGLAVLGVIALGELYTLMERVRPPALAGFLTLAALLAAALYGEPRHVVMVLVAAFPVTFFLALARPRRANVSWAIAVTMFGVLWIGLAMVHAIWLRDLSIEQDGETIVTGMGLVVRRADRDLRRRHVRLLRRARLRALAVRAADLAQQDARGAAWAASWAARSRSGAPGSTRTG